MYEGVRMEKIASRVVQIAGFRHDAARGLTGVHMLRTGFFTTTLCIPHDVTTFFGSPLFGLFGIL